VNNGQRIETYAIELREGSGDIILNGPAARHFHVGDKVIIAAFCLTDETLTPRMIAVDDRNRLVRTLTHDDSDASLVAEQQ
jgi:aspartate 1-decarboxylase